MPEKLQLNGVPKGWPLKEVASAWKEAHRKKVSEAVSLLPEVLLKGEWNIGRLKQSILSSNRASNADMKPRPIVLYDNAFDGKYPLARILAHEFAHAYYQSLTEEDIRPYQIATEWHHSVRNPDKWYSRKDGYVEEDGRESPEEDFANNVEYYLFDPSTLKAKTPYAFHWIDENIKDLKLKKGCVYEN